MLTFRVWLTSNTALTAAGIAAAVAACVLFSIALAVLHGIPVMNVALVMLLPLSLGGFWAIPHARPAAVPPSRRRVAVPVEAPTRVPGTRVPAPLPGWCGAGTPNAPGRHFPAGRATRPAPAGRPPRGVPSAGAGRATASVGVR